MSTYPVIGDTIKLSKFPPNRSMMDWDRVLEIGWTGHIMGTHTDSKTNTRLYNVWFSSRNKQEGWEVWLSREHFKHAYE